jgi:arylsulfatase A-like enzyme
LGLEDRVLAEYFPAPPDLIRRQGKIHGCDFRLAGFRRGALQRDGVKYIWSSGGDHELYDLAADPVEEHNLIADRPQLAQALDAELRSWLRSLQPQHSDAQHSELDPVTKKALEALGYVQ